MHPAIRCADERDSFAKWIGRITSRLGAAPSRPLALLLDEDPLASRARGISAPVTSRSSSYLDDFEQDFLHKEIRPFRMIAEPLTTTRIDL